jgi:Glycosyl transferase family 2
MDASGEGAEINANPTLNPVASIVIVSDYKVGSSLAWDDLRATLRGVAAQDFSEPVEYIFLENVKHKDHVPSDLSQILPQLKIIFSRHELQYALKSEAASVAQSEIVILLDGDCVPAPDWLRHMVQMMRLSSKPAVVSGRTLYEGRNLIERCCALLERAYVDRSRSAETENISNNNAAFRRSVLLAHPLPLNAGPFASGMHAEAIMRAGGRLFFEPQARVTHAYHGWQMQRDIRRHKGYARIVTRQLDSNLPFATLGRLGYLSIPLIFGGSLLQSWWKSVLFHRDYGIRWYQFPVLIFFAVVVHGMEIPGIIRGIHGRPITKSHYR